MSKERGRSPRSLLYYKYMSLFRTTQSPAVRYGAVIEIGSGSVLVSIVKSDQSKSHPDIIWVKREYASKQNTSILDAKGVMTALLNGVMLIKSEGMKILRTQAPHAKLGLTQFSITAPWSYTISKVINYSEAQPFTVTNVLLKKLLTAAEKKVTEELRENEVATDLGLTIMTRATTDIQANGYKTVNPVGQEVMSLTLTQVSAVAQKYLTDAILELQQKMLPQTTLELYSFMLIFHCIIRDLHQGTSEYCLIDVTFEATEIGIVDGGILRYCTHTATGSNSIITAIATELNIPLAEAEAFLKEPYHTHAMGELNEQKRQAVNQLFKNYQATITKLFHEIGSSLSIPKTLWLHGGEQMEDFFATQIAAAAKAATSGEHVVYTVKNELLATNYTTDQKKKLLSTVPDTALLVATQFFHKQQHCNNFIQV